MEADDILSWKHARNYKLIWHPAADTEDILGRAQHYSIINKTSTRRAWIRSPARTRETTKRNSPRLKGFIESHSSEGGAVLNGTLRQQVLGASFAWLNRLTIVSDRFSAAGTQCDKNGGENPGRGGTLGEGLEIDNSG